MADTPARRGASVSVGRGSGEPTSGGGDASTEQEGDGGRWLSALDIDAFGTECRKLHAELRAAEGEEDMAHLRRIVRATDLLYLAGLALLPLPWWLLAPAAALAFANTVRWACVAHHAQHGGYNRCDASGRYHRGRFAMGAWRRAADWMDWMLPEAWDEEHNRLHHYHTNEVDDPDLVEHNFQKLRQMPLPRAVKLAIILPLAASWKWLYYASNSWKSLRLKRVDCAALPAPHRAFIEGPLLLMRLPWWPHFLLPVEFVFRVLAPYVVLRLLLPVAAWGALAGGWAAARALQNVLLAELLASLHSFTIIVPNHAGRDLYRFDSPVTPLSAEYHVRQVVSSANFATGADLAAAGWGVWAQDLCDLSHGWLNYQIEHHLFPNLSMLSYRRAQPKVRALCRRHGVPYVQEPVLVRTARMLEIMTGHASHRRWPGAP